MLPNRLQYINLVILILLFALAIYSIVSRIWVSEDAYITFKYIDNLFQGNGLTFNKGEKVEGFTHPLWAGLLILLRTFGIHSHPGSVVLGLFFSFTGLILTIYLYKPYKKAIFILPTILIINEGFRDFSTSGLEFSLTFFLIVLLFMNILEKDLDKNPIALSVILSCAYLTRPELGILLAYYSLLYFYKNYNNFSGLVRFGIPIVLLVGGYHAFRLYYYGDIFPNTYYAKSGWDTNYTQGVKYLYHTIRYSPLVIPVFLVFTYVLIKKKIHTTHSLSIETFSFSY